MPYLDLCEFASSNLMLDSQPLRRLQLKTTPIEVLTPRATRRRKAAGIRVHSLEGPLPKKSILGITSALYTVSPELCFMQLVPSLSFEALVLLGCEMCGRYALRPDLKTGMTPRLPLTSKGRLLTFIGKTKGMKNSQTAEEAALMVADDCASPMEAVMYLLLCLPRRRGGYGLPQPEMNRTIPLSPKAAQAFGSTYYVGDAVWPRHKVILEYDGLEGHSGRKRIAHDAGRRDALTAEGYSVFVLTIDQLVNDEQFRIIAHAIAKKLGIRLRIRQADFDHKQQSLRKALLPFS